MDAHDFYWYHLPKLQGWMTVAVGAFLVIEAILCTAWVPFSSIGLVGAVSLVFLLASVGFHSAEYHYREKIGVPNPPRFRRAWPIFHAASAIGLAAGVWAGHSVSAVAVVGAVWLLLYRRQVAGLSWGGERLSAAALATIALLMPMMEVSVREFNGAACVAVVGVTFTVKGLLDRRALVQTVQRMKVEAGELDS